MARIVEFTDGFTSASAPNNGPISASQLLNYASDGAYEAANGAGQPGDLYFNTATNKIRQHTATIWEDVVSASSVSATKFIQYVDTAAYVAAQGAAVSGSCFMNTTTNHINIYNGTTWTVVDYSSEVMHLTGNETATGNKTFSNDVIIGGDLTVNGTTTTLNTTNLEVEDTNILINNGGNDATSEGAGITIERTATNAGIFFEAALASKFKAGLVGSEVELVNKTAIQTLTNKTIDGDDNTITDLPLTALKTNLGHATTFVVRDAAGLVVSGTKIVPVGDPISANSTATLSNKLLADDSVSFYDQGALDVTKKLSVDVTGTTGTTTTLATVQTANRTVTLPDATTTLVGTDTSDNLSNKTLVHPEINNTMLFQQTTTPANPAANKNKIYFKSDDKAYRLNSAGTESELGSGGGGGTKNYITNTGAESNTTDYSTFDDGAVTRPVDGTGGSPTVISLSRSTTSPLSGAGQFLITKTAASAQGEGVSVPFTIDLEDQGSLQAIEFTYKVVSGTFLAGTGVAGGEGDLIVSIYDVTNAVLIEPTNIQLTSNSTTAAKFYAAFQASSNSVSYRLIWMCPNTGTTAYSLAFDSVKVGPQLKAIGPIVSDWTTFTPTGGFTNTTYAGKWRRVGDSIQISVDGFLTGTPTGNLTIDYPTGIIPDVAKLSTGGVLESLGTGIGLVGSTRYVGIVSYNSTASVRINGPSTTGIWTATNPGSWASADRFDFFYQVPVLGWSSQVQMSADMGASEVSARYGATTSTLTGSVGIVKFSTKTVDTINGYSTSTGLFTCQSSGRYRVYGQILVNGTFTDTDPTNIYIYKNGSSVAVGQKRGTTITTNFIGSTQVTDIINCVAGDTIAIYASSGGTSLSIYDEATYSFFSIEKLANPSPILMSEFVAPTRQTFTSGSGTYTLPTGTRPKYLKIKMIGGGGGGSGSSTSVGGASNGSAGGSTTFGTSLLTATGGDGGVFNTTAGAAGGTGTINSPAIGLAISGGNGQAFQVRAAADVDTQLAGGSGGQGVFGGGAFSTISGTPAAGKTNTGGGGCGGAAPDNAARIVMGSGGGAGGYIEAIISNPSSTYSYAVGTAGSNGSAGTSGLAGSNGGSGVIYIEEYYS